MAYKVGAEALREWVPSQVEAPVWSPSISVQRHRPFFFLYITVTLLYDIAYSGFHTGLEMADFFLGLAVDSMTAVRYVGDGETCSIGLHSARRVLCERSVCVCTLCDSCLTFERHKYR